MSAEAASVQESLGEESPPLTTSAVSSNFLGGVLGVKQD
jgi:hypothetical protein